MSKINIDISVNQRDAQQKLDRLTRSTKDASSGFDRLSLSIKQSGSAFSSFLGNVSAVAFNKFVGGLVELGTSSIKVTGELETLRTQFEVLTGSAGMANKAVQDLQQFAANTPFQFKDLAQATQRLLSFGFTLEESQKNLVALGDVAAASGGNINDLALIFGQVNAAGKLTGERLLQLQERAIPIGPALAKTLGKAESSIRDLVSKGQIDFATFEKAFLSLNKTGEFAFEGMVKRSRTLDGRISTLKDNFELLQATIGQRLAPVLKSIITTLTLFIQKIQASANFNSFLETLGKSIPEAISFSVDAFSFLVNSVLNTVKIFNLFRSGVTTALSVIINALTQFVDIYAGVINALGLGDTAIGRAINNVKEFKNGVISALDDTAAGFAKQAADIDASQKQVNETIGASKKYLLNTYNEELMAAEAQANAKVEANNKIKDSEKALTEEELAEIEKRRLARIKLAEDIKNLEQELLIQQDANRIYYAEQETIFTESRLVAIQDYFSREEQARIEANLKQIEDEDARHKYILSQELAAAKKKIEIKKQAAEEEARIQQLTLTKTSSFFGAAASLARQGGKEQFELSKKLSIAQILLNGYQQISEAAKLPWPANIPAVAYAVADNAGRLVAANAVRPSFEQGGIVPGTSFTGDNVTANVNSGEMILNRQQQTRLFQMVNGQSATSQTYQANITVELDNEVVGRATSKWVANGGQLGEVQ